MLGTARVRVHGVRDVDLHGDRYHDLTLTLSTAAEGTAPAALRVPAAMCGGRPEIGSELEIELLMGQVQAVRAAPAPGV
jgi:hypothetical protein